MPGTSALTTTASILLYFLSDLGAVSALLLIFRSVFLRNFAVKASKVSISVLLIAAAAVFDILMLPGLTEQWRAVADALSNLLILASIVLFAGKKGILKTLITAEIYLFTTDMLYSFVAPYTGDRLWSECLILSSFYAVTVLIVVFGIKSSPVNILPEVFARIPKWFYATLMLFELTCYFREFGEEKAFYDVIYAVSSIAVIACLMYLIFQIFLLVYRQNKIVAQIEEQKAFVDEIRSDNEDVRRFRHDYNNHMIVVNALLESGRSQEAREYLSTISDTLGNRTTRIKTGNFVADAVLNHKLIQVSGQNITISFEGMIPPDMIEAADLCVMLGNLLDNALDAAKKSDGASEISVSGVCAEDAFILTIRNEIPDGAVIDTSSTSKSDKRSHGFGIKNVRSAAEKYSGSLSLRSQSGSFTATVYIPIKRAEKGNTK